MVEVLLAAYNGSLYIEDQIKSIMNQSYKDWKLVVGDDGSKDETVAIVNNIADNYQRKIGDGSMAQPQITVKINEKPCGGPAGNFLQLLKSANGDYIMFSDQDDVWHPDKIEKTMKAMEKLEQTYGKDIPLLVYTDLRVVDSELKPIADSFINYMKLPKEIILSRLLIQNNVTGCTIMLNRTLCELLKRVDQPDKILMHDHFAALAAEVLGHVAFVPEATIDYRQHGDNSVGASDARSFTYLWHRYRRGKKNFRRDLYNSMIQAGYFYSLYEKEIENNVNKKKIYSYSKLNERKKWSRIWFYVKYRALKYGWIRAVMQIVWG